MSVSGDYNNYAAGGSSCSYASLGVYNSEYSMGVAPQGKVSSGQFIVPTWSPISYDALTSRVGNCSGYNSIENAYGKDAASCQTTYRTSLCGSASK